MDNVVNRQIDNWVRPWNIESFSTLSYKDERFFAILLKGLLSYLNQHIVLYNNPINHFIYNTGTGYLYLEKTGYEYTLTETSNDDEIYHKLPRCIVDIDDFSFDSNELSNPFVSAVYERKSSLSNEIKAYTAETRRLPVELSINLKYVLGNFNESIILIEELINKLLYQTYFSITYLGNEIKCSLECPLSNKIEFNKIDMTAKELSTKTIELSCKLCSSYPIINTRTETDASNVIKSFNTITNVERNENVTDEVHKTGIKSL